MGGFVPFIKALPPCFGFYDPVKEEDDCEVCHTSKFQEVDFDGEDITQEEGLVRVSFVYSIPISTCCHWNGHSFLEGKSKSQDSQRYTSSRESPLAHPAEGTYPRYRTASGQRP
jgi:hypothetical protein